MSEPEHSEVGIGAVSERPGGSTRKPEQRALIEESRVNVGRISLIEQ